MSERTTHFALGYAYGALAVALEDLNHLRSGGSFDETLSRAIEKLELAKAEIRKALGRDVAAKIDGTAHAECVHRDKR